MDTKEIIRVREQGVIETHEIDPHVNPEKPDHNERSIQRDRVATFNSGTLVTDNTVPVYGPSVLTWIPERWIVVSRLTAGSIFIHLGSGRSALKYHADNGVVVLPMPNEAITIEHIGASGYYDIYALSGYPEFSIILA